MQHKSQTVLFLILLFLITLVPAKAQDFSDDAAVWMNIYLEKKVNDHWDIHLNQQNRINDNISEYGMGYADIGVTYRFNKNWKIMGDYVWMQRRIIDNSFSMRHQYYAALVFKQKYGKWEFMYRNMVQGQVKDVLSSEKGKVPQYYERNKFTLKYDLNKYFTIYTAEELYLPFNQTKSKGFDRSRTFAGLFYNFSKRTSLETYFMFQRELNAFAKTNRIFAYGLGLSHEF